MLEDSCQEHGVGRFNSKLYDLLSLACTHCIINVFDLEFAFVLCHVFFFFLKYVKYFYFSKWIGQTVELYPGTHVVFVFVFLGNFSFNKVISNSALQQGNTLTCPPTAVVRCNFGCQVARSKFGWCQIMYLCITMYLCFCICHTKC